MSSVAACAPVSDLEEPAPAPAEDPSLRVATLDPRARVGTFDLDREYGDTSFMAGDFRLSGHPITPGTRKEVPIGSLSLSAGSASFADGRLPYQSRSFTIKEGETITSRSSGPPPARDTAGAE